MVLTNNDEMYFMVVLYAFPRSSLLFVMKDNSQRAVNINKYTRESSALSSRVVASNPDNWTNVAEMYQITLHNDGKGSSEQRIT